METNNQKIYRFWTFKNYGLTLVSRASEADIKGIQFEMVARSCNWCFGSLDRISGFDFIKSCFILLPTTSTLNLRKIIEINTSNQFIGMECVAAALLPFSSAAPAYKSRWQIYNL